MTLCPHCQRAERELWPIYGPDLCCKARSVANTPPVLMPAAYDAAITGLDEAQAAWVRDRAYALIREAKGRAA
jgi:hypothetical protein